MSKYIINVTCPECGCGDIKVYYSAWREAITCACMNCGNQGKVKYFEFDIEKDNR